MLKRSLCCRYSFLLLNADKLSRELVLDHFNELNGTNRVGLQTSRRVFDFQLVIGSFELAKSNTIRNCKYDGTYLLVRL